MSSIGRSYQGRPIRVMEVDAREALLSEREEPSKVEPDFAEDEHENKIWDTYADNVYGPKPAILLTGQHHSREAITSSMVLGSILKMLHGALHGNEKYRKLLIQNKYYAIPTVNVDGVNYIEETYKRTGVLEAKRTNMHIGKDAKCNATVAGVDLNRNYGYKWGVGDSGKAECDETYHGASAFSEPETRAMRDWLRAHRDELKFVINYHSAGNILVLPYNGEFSNQFA